MNFKERDMQKKVIAIIIVIALAAAGVFGYIKFLSPKGIEGEKSVTIIIQVDEEDIDYEGDFDTDEEFLLGLLENEDGELEVEFLNSNFGPMVIGMKGYSADQNSEYFHITVNGEDAMVGVSEIPLEEDGIYMFEIKGF